MRPSKKKRKTEMSKKICESTVIGNNQKNSPRLVRKMSIAKKKLGTMNLGNTDGRRFIV